MSTKTETLETNTPISGGKPAFNPAPYSCPDAWIVELSWKQPAEKFGWIDGRGEWGSNFLAVTRDGEFIHHFLGGPANCSRTLVLPRSEWHEKYERRRRLYEEWCASAVLPSKWEEWSLSELESVLD